ncbi:MAG: mannitol dehydrogenase family protein [Treponema sp.]|jgi:mannitol-1-phosphate/altronate dehydrogenase|nr:mannitol dehydrogenase family protein [Treponema sp.]
MTGLKLCAGNLTALGDRGLRIPRYDRKALRPRLVHLGLGHFHRAHQAAYIDELLNRGLCDSGIFEINLVPDTYPLAEIALEQDYLYTLLARSPAEEEPRIIGSIIGYLNAASRPEEALAILGRRETAAISLTVTEKGYYYDTVREDLAWDHEDLIHDAAFPDKPRTTIGFLALALERRRKEGAGPVTVMSCDNFPSNGKILARCLDSFCRKTRPALAAWIRENVAFPLSMVDRITPGTTETFLEELAERYGIRDRWAVGCEDFRQWVLEDHFQEGFPLGALDKAGVQIVREVEPYELMKIRLLNGSHSALAYPAYLMGHRGVAEAIEDSLLRRFIRDFYMEQIGSAVPPVPGIDLKDYKDTLIRRFSNRNIADTVLRLASDGSKKVPNAILKPLAELEKKNAPHGAVVFALASWARFLTGQGEEGDPIPLEDPAAPELSAATLKAGEDPAGFLRTIGMPETGEDKLSPLARELQNYVTRIKALGIRRALESFLRHDNSL